MRPPDSGSLNLAERALSLICTALMLLSPAFQARTSLLCSIFLRINITRQWFNGLYNRVGCSGSDAAAIFNTEMFLSVISAFFRRLRV